MGAVMMTEKCLRNGIDSGRVDGEDKLQKRLWSKALDHNNIQESLDALIGQCLIGDKPKHTKKE
jgi:hypothetical protein